MGTPGGFNNFGRERTAREIGEEHRQKLLKQAEVKRIKHELREARKAQQDGEQRADTARPRSFTALRVIALVVLMIVLLALVVLLVHGV